jgi:hypothetical protein
MPTDRLPLQRPLRGNLTVEQAQELCIGINHNIGSYFVDTEAAEAAWARHRDWLMREFGNPGKRPLAFYVFDRPDLPFDVDHETSILWRAGALTPAEKIAVEQEWHAEFTRAYSPGFSVARRRQHLDWADVPSELRKCWRLQQRRPAKVKELGAEQLAG